MMAERKMDGARIGVHAELSLDERMARIRLGYLAEMGGRTAFDSPWYGLRVAFGRELAVENALREHDIECMVPMRKGKERRVRHRVIAAKSEPAITGYVLVRFALSNESCVGILAVEHVVGLVGTEGRPFPISHEEAMRFKAKADDGELDWAQECRVSFRKGDRVRLSAGPFASFPAVVVAARSDRKGDAVVEVDVFGRMTAATVPLAILEKL